ncbi:fatty-acid amide hydrolase 2-A-like [Hylaeus volcanicus]|uniref:fatty-acid amide hydrolase 2-A-like n=1 Tax=Hylaeus volcanicus TaxID=313075 RepID=UPI0023B859F5|nr:fatty-acid amide hydrolase 2-A-like [Hylaeus volcanicus]
MTLMDICTISIHFLYFFLRPIFALIFLRKRPKIPPIKNQLLLDSATTLAKKIKSGEVSSQTIVEAYIERIKEVNPFINVVVDDRFVEAVNDAKICDAKLKSGEVTAIMLENEKPLFGIPFTVKESCSVAGKKRECNKTPCISYLVFSRRQEGALLGAGASILGIGSDMMGSIRIPSFFNGVFGHKPTPGIIPNNGHIPDYSQFSMFVQGPLARYAEDLILAVKVMSVDCDVPLHLDKPLDVKNLRIFYVENIKSFCGIRSTTSDVRQSIRKALRYLSGNGARVEHVIIKLTKN